VDLGAFYSAFSPACFALLGLWLVVVQIRLPAWEKNPERRRRSYGVALHFALPGIMSVFALIDVHTSFFWRWSFAIVAASGAVIMAAVRGFPVPAERNQAAGSRLPAADRLGLWTYVAAIVFYVLIGVMAVVGGNVELRTAAVLQTLLIFLGFNVAWLLLLDDGGLPAGRAPGQTEGSRRPAH
jgi:hypothetical protein